MTQPSKMLTWIHVSDVHFGHGKDATTRFDQEAVVSKILDDVEKVRSVLGSPDFLIFTGDIAFSGEPKQYETAKDWIDKLLSVAGAGVHQCLLVPGNHDVQRRKTTGVTVAALHKALRAEPNRLDDFLAQGELGPIWQKFEAYSTFAAPYGSGTITAEQPFWSKKIDSPLGDVLAIGLNTCLNSYDSADAAQNLALGLGQIHRTITGAPKNALLLVLQHHPPSWLSDGSTLRGHLQHQAHVLFCGHVHDAQGFLRTPITSQGTFELVAGAGHQDVKEEGNHAYSWGRLTPDQFEYYPRAWSKAHTCFLAQQTNPTKEFKRHSEELGDYIIVPRDRLPSALAKWLRTRIQAIPIALPPQVSGNPTEKPQVPSVGGTPDVTRPLPTDRSSPTAANSPPGTSPTTDRNVDQGTQPQPGGPTPPPDPVARSWSKRRWLLIALAVIAILAGTFLFVYVTVLYKDARASSTSALPQTTADLDAPTETPETTASGSTTTVDPDPIPSGVPSGALTSTTVPTNTKTDHPPPKKPPPPKVTATPPPTSTPQDVETERRTLCNQNPKLPVCYKYYGPRHGQAVDIANSEGRKKGTDIVNRGCSQAALSGDCAVTK
ncbi:MAG: metallophosphoesterase [Polyangiaceae bacterium]|nr:metallophosphoesterase [Polyangiaceae bacterium]